MATQQTAFTSTCLMCYESRTLKIVGKCKHSFCVECLTTLLGSLGREKETFPCPSCKVDCRVPPNGPKALMDFNGAIEDLTITEADAEVEDTVDEICDLCNYKQQKVKAASVCNECDHINICQDCSLVHRKNKATTNHILTPIIRRQREDEPMCDSHGKPLSSFCATCAQPVCMICVSLLHGDHDIEKLADAIRSKVEEVKVTSQVQKEKLKSLKQVKRELKVLNTTLILLDEEKDFLIKQIEDHAQEVINQVVKWKEESKTEIEDDFKVKKDIHICFEKVSVTVQKLEQTINKVSQLLSDSELNPVYLDKLTTLQQNLGAISGEDDASETEQFKNRLVDLHKNRRVFVSEKVPLKYGHIEKRFAWKPVELTSFFEHTMKVDSETMTIPHVTCLGSKHFAVAHPVKPGQLPNAIDIYELQGTFKHTLSRDQMGPFYDMSSTPDGLLALLSDGERGGSCSVKLFDPLTGYVSSTQNFTIAKPMSFGVTIQHQYVILGGNQEGKLQITVVDEAGCVEYEHVLDGTSAPEKITCGWKFIFTGGRYGITVYELKDTGLLRINHIKGDGKSLMADISATAWDDVVITLLDNDLNHGLLKFTERQRQWRFSGCSIPGSDCESGASVSTRDGDIVVWSCGHTIHVNKLDCH